MIVGVCYIGVGFDMKISDVKYDLEFVTALDLLYRLKGDFFE